MSFRLLTPVYLTHYKAQASARRGMEVVKCHTFVTRCASFLANACSASLLREVAMSVATRRAKPVSFRPA